METTSALKYSGGMGLGGIRCLRRSSPAKIPASPRPPQKDPSKLESGPFHRPHNGGVNACLGSWKKYLSIYFRNMPPPAHYIAKKCSALHARVLFLFDQLKEKYHVCGLDNLYNSVKFCRDAWAGKKKIMVHGVARKTGRGVPDCCQQEEFSDPAKAEAVRGTTKAAVLDGDPNCTPVVCVSIYDTKVVAILSTACTF
mmetsp:Transcript_21050/g.30062  ORF Transcript_21050/g.30062 Transcript_21050/m.30062 type:complete len:198 (+) Transcript_21050:754-1347(+)